MCFTDAQMFFAYDEYNNGYEFIDEEIRQRIEAKLMIQIVYKFDPTRMPVSSE